MLPLGDTNDNRSVPIINWLLIGINILVFVFEVRLPEAQLSALLSTNGFIPERFVQHPDLGQFATIGTSMFMHGGWSHLLFNMWFLYIFGDNVEDRLGHFPYLLFYLLCGLLADASHLAFGGMSAVPTVGASGAISGVLGAYMVMFPKAKVKTLLRYSVIEIPASIYLLMWFGSNLVSGLFAAGAVDKQVGGVAFWAHIGGFVVGLVYAFLFARPQNTPELAERLRQEDVF